MYWSRDRLKKHVNELIILYRHCKCFCTTSPAVSKFHNDFKLHLQGLRRCFCKPYKSFYNFSVLKEILEVKLLSGQVREHSVTSTACLLFFFCLVLLLLHIPSQQYILNKLSPELRCRNFVNKHRRSMQIDAKCARTCMQCVHIATELPFCIPPLVVG